MPEAAVHKNDLPSAGEDHVWSSRKLLVVETVSVTQPVDETAHGELGA
jgi:hypothetical protein